MEHNTSHTAVLKIEGNLLSASSAALFKLNVGRLLSGNTTRLILDLNKLSAVDKGGLRLMIHVLKKLQGGGELVICGASENISNLIVRTGLGSLIQVEQQITTDDLGLLPFLKRKLVTSILKI